MKARFLEILIDIRDNFDRTANPSCGICTNVKSMLRTDMEIALTGRMMRELFYQWPEFSGDPWFPVPDPNGVDLPDAAFCFIVDKWTGPYGESRIRLLNFMIGELSK